MRRSFPLLMILSSIICKADMTEKVRMVITDSKPSPNVQNPVSLRSVYYRHAGMRRKDNLREDGTPSISSIANCVTGTGFLIDMSAGEYRSYTVAKFMSPKQMQEYAQKHPKDMVQVESRTIETGERKTFFGYEAKHFITTVKPAGSDGEEITDGWYIDHERPENNCTPEFTRSDPFYVIRTMLAMYPKVAQFHHSGPLPTGLAVKVTRTVKFAGNGSRAPGRTLTSEEIVEDLSDSPLRPSLFELPSRLRENSKLLRAQPSSRE
jgi:hypothetical protein